MKLDSATAWENIEATLRAKIGRVPKKTKFSPQYDGECFLPIIKPSFTINKSDKFFTIGSCFAREIDKALSQANFNVSGIRLPNVNIINEYNPMSMLQRVKSAVNEFEYPHESCILQIGNNTDDFIDLYTVQWAEHGISFARLVKIRKQIDNYYRKHLMNSDVIVITLGLIECWYDTVHQVYLNSTPFKKCCQAEPNRYVFRRLTIDECLNAVDEIIQILNKHGAEKKIILTVSPIPLDATFIPGNIILSTSFSKAVLRIVAQQITEKYCNVDYFPSFEIVTSHGCAGLADDNAHVPAFVIDKIINLVYKTYLKA